DYYCQSADSSGYIF
nr:immunoglobulin light chain junction region [Macaca mulatta]